VLDKSTCASFCPCEAEPPFAGTVSGQVQLIRCTAVENCCKKFPEEWDLNIQGIGLCAAELGQSLPMKRISADCWQWSDIVNCGDFMQLTVCCKENGTVQMTYNVPCAVPASGSCTITNVNCDNDPPTFNYQCVANEVGGCQCCNGDPTSTTTSSTTTTTTPAPTTLSLIHI
jgi:hypothetical protein